MRFPLFGICALLLFPLIFSSCSKQTLKGETNANKQIDVSNGEMNGNTLHLQVKKKVLSNGLRVLVHENHKLPILSISVLYDVGGRYESRQEKTTGATHFLEHMMFKGSKNYAQGQFDTLIEKSGGSTNAYTTFDSTVYYENLPSAMLPNIMDMEADRMSNLLLDADAFEKERKVIFEERKYRYENSPNGKLFLRMMQEAFKGTPYGGSVIGDESDLKALTRDQVFSFYQQFYAPNNAILIVTGDVDSSEVFRLAQEHFSKIPERIGLSEFKQKKDASENFKLRSKLSGSLNLHGQSPSPLFAFVYAGEALGTQRAFVMDIVASILGSGQSSFLVQQYVKSRRPILNNISVSNYNMQNSGLFFVTGELLKGVSLSKFHDRFLREGKRFCRQSINERNLQKTRNQFLIGYLDELKTNAGVAGFLGTREKFFGDYEYYKKELETYNSISQEEALKVCEEIFLPGKALFVSLWEKNPKTK